MGRASKAFPYVFKIWRCGQLVARSRVRYDAIVRLRPDLIPQVPFHLSRWGGDGFELRVGPVCTQFGARAVVVHAFTNYCANDWLAVGGAAAMTLTMDLARFWTPASRWLSADAVLDETLSSGVEIAHNNLWRTHPNPHRSPLTFHPNLNPNPNPNQVAAHGHARGARATLCRDGAPPLRAAALRAHARVGGARQARRLHRHRHQQHSVLRRAHRARRARTGGGRRRARLARRATRGGRDGSGFDAGGAARPDE